VFLIEVKQTLEIEVLSTRDPAPLPNVGITEDPMNEKFESNIDICKRNKPLLTPNWLASSIRAYTTSEDVASTIQGYQSYVLQRMTTDTTVQGRSNIPSSTKAAQRCPPAVN
jgi:hypothetical protein